MADWQDIKQKAERITARLRAVRPANILSDQENFRPLADRIPRPGAVDLVARSRAKKGHEISGTQMTALKNGAVKIDAKLDLHGMTQAAAHQELGYFLQKQIAGGARMLLIITGKGKNNEGVLRHALPGWLMTGEFKNYILTIHPAHVRHGGDGATYVLLRKIK
jgi:DNA-nicking Smr family endonuclease